ncbi:MAG: tetratricopeptide repeat protein, partial [Bacteroidales bacterium]
YTKEEKTKPSSDLIKQASMLFETLLEGHPKEASGYSLYGKFLWRYSDSKKAQSMFEKALLLDSTSAINWELLLTIADVNKDTSVSLHYAQRAIQLFPEQAIFYLFPAAVYSMQKENLSQTIFYAQKARQLCMENNSYNLRMSLVFLGEAYSELKEYDSAISIYEILIKLDPKSKVIKNNYAYQLALKGRNLEEAERLMADLCKENPNDPTFLDTYAWVLFKKGDYKKAKTLLEDALKMDKKMDPTVVEHYGDVLFKLGELEEALEQWKRASRLSSFPNEILIEKINQQQWISE